MSTWNFIHQLISLIMASAFGSYVLGLFMLAPLYASSIFYRERLKWFMVASVLTSLLFFVGLLVFWYLIYLKAAAFWVG